MYGQNLAKQLGLTTTTISHHMSELASNGFVSIEADGKKFFFTLREESIEEFLKQISQKLLT